MKRVLLKSLGLEKNIIDKIMAENGKDIQVEKAKINQLEAERASILNDLDKANRIIQSYIDMDIESIKKSAFDWEVKAKGMEAELLELKRTSALKEALMKTDAFDPEIVLKILDHNAIIFEDGEIRGLEDQILYLTKTKSYLFKSEKQTRFKPHIPKDS